jgi:hypothetical protein
MSYYYVLDENNVAIPAKEEDFGRWYKNGKYRVDLTIIPERNVEVSTVFLGLNHQREGKEPPLIFETMIFNLSGDSVDGISVPRYSTWDEAQSRASSDCCADQSLRNTSRHLA